jgi:hypothetical protein
MELIGTGWIDELIAVTALLVALWAAWRARRAETESEHLGRRVADFEEAMERIRLAEASSAQLVPSLEREFGPSGHVVHRLRIENIGRGAATDLRMRIGGQLLVSGGGGEAEPREIDEIPPGMAVSLPIPATERTVDGTLAVELNWLDAAGRQQTSRARLGAR